MILFNRAKHINKVTNHQRRFPDFKVFPESNQQLLKSKQRAQPSNKPQAGMDNGRSVV
jgi:hypothetical protein